MRFLLIGHIVCPVELTRGKSNLGLGLSGSGNVLGPQEAWGGAQWVPQYLLVEIAMLGLVRNASWK